MKEETLVDPHNASENIFFIGWHRVAYYWRMLKAPPLFTCLKKNICMFASYSFFMRTDQSGKSSF